MADAKQIPRLRTARLVLRPFTLADARDVQRLAGDATVADTLVNVPHPYEDGMAAEWISKHQQKFEAGEDCTLAITLAETGELIGAISLMISQRFNRAEMGYWIGVPYWNKGYCTEAAGAVVDFGFSQLGLRRIFAQHFARNPASGRVMIKLGMKHEGVARQHIKKGDRYEDAICYGILAEEWRVGAHEDEELATDPHRWTPMKQ